MSHYYDPLLAKLIVHAEDRPAAIRRMQAALREYVVHGVITNIDFLQDILAHPDFQSGSVSTTWVEEAFKWQPAPVSPDSLTAAAVSDLRTPARSTLSSGPAEADPFSPWQSTQGFRN